MSAPVLVLCMAGLYSRFRQAGYTTPKFLLTVGGESILGRIVRELAPEHLVCVANERDRRREPAIRAACARAGVTPDLRFVGDTSGQAETAAIGARRVRALGLPGPIVFHNVDTVLLGRDLAAIGRILSDADGYIDVFDNDSPAYSYVEVDSAGRVVDIAEKVVISRHATTGLYGFRSAAYYLERAALTTHRSRGEFYVSDVYRSMLDDGADIRTDPAGGPAVVLGTPAEYEAWVAEHGA